MLIDLHYHFSPSESAIAEFPAMISAIREKGIDGLCVCLPPTAGDGEKLIELGAANDFPIFIGREFKTEDGVILGILPDVAPVDESVCEELAESPQKVLDFIKEKNGLSIIAQPYSREADEPIFQDKILDLEKISCIEVVNGKTTSVAAEMALDTAVNLQTKIVAGGENPEGDYNAGVFFLNDIKSQKDFIDGLGGGDYWVFILGSDPIKTSDDRRGRRNDRRPSWKRDGRDSRGRGKSSGGYSGGDRKPSYNSKPRTRNK